MVSLKVNYQGKNFVLNLPTMFNEVNMDYLKSLVANVEVAPYYSLVAVLFKERPTVIISSLKQNKTSNVQGVSVMIKQGNNNNKDSEFINNIKTGTLLNVSGSDLALGYHVAPKYNSLSATFLAKLATSNKSLYNDCMSIDKPTYFVEFKIIPNTAIHAAISNDSKPVIDYYFREEVESN